MDAAEGGAGSVRDSLEGIYRDHRQGLYSLALSITRQPALAEDAVQEAFARLWRRGTTANGDPVAYTFATVRNTAIDTVSRKQTAATDPASLYNGQYHDPSESVLADETADRLRDAVDNLPDEQRHAVVMKVYAGLTFQQIAEACDEPLSTISSRYQRALCRLREVLGDEE